jgi:hypothetical protein
MGQPLGDMSTECCTYFQGNVGMLMSVVGGDLEAMVTDETCGTCRDAVTVMFGTAALVGQELEDAETQFDEWCSGGDEEAEPCSVMGQPLGDMTTECCTYFQGNIGMLMSVMGGDLEAMVTDETCGTCRNAVTVMLGGALVGQELEDAETQFDAWCSAGDEVDLGPDVDCTVVWNFGLMPEKCCAALTGFAMVAIEAVGSSADVEDATAEEASELLEDSSSAGTAQAAIEALQTDPLLCGECIEALSAPIDFLGGSLLGGNVGLDYSDFLAQSPGKSVTLSMWCGFAFPQELSPVGSCDQKLIDMVQEYDMGGLLLQTRAGDWWPYFESNVFCDPSTGTPAPTAVKGEMSYVMSVFATW